MTRAQLFLGVTDNARWGENVRIACVQTKPKIMEVEENVDRAIETIDGLDADLVVLPELFNTGYALTREELERVSEEVPEGYTLNRLRDTCKERRIAIVAGFAERSGKDFYNSAVLVTPRGMKVHRKVHLFGKEKRIFKPGGDFEVHRYGKARIGMMVCFDWFFPESCRTLMLKGAEIITHPANLVLPFWPKAAMTRAVENRVFVATASRIGQERGLNFVGGSLIVSPSGNVLTSLGPSQTGVAVAEIDPSEARDKKVTLLNDIRKDRRPRAYELG